MNPSADAKFAVLLCAALLMASWAAAPAGAEDLKTQKVYGVAIQGYDPVAYFTMDRAVPGSPEYRYDWNEATWYFASEEHRKLFAADPEQYAPSHDGVCAVSMVVGSLVEPDPRIWKIANERLYLGWSGVASDRFPTDEELMQSKR